MDSAALFHFMNLASDTSCEDEEDTTGVGVKASQFDSDYDKQHVLKQEHLNVRTATNTDTVDLEALYWQHSWIRKIYDHSDLHKAAQGSAFNLVVENVRSTRRIIGQVIYHVHPCIAEIEPANWQEWFFKNLQVTPKTVPMVTLFQTMVSCSENERTLVVRAALSWLFREISYLEQVIHINRKRNDENTTFLWWAGFTAVSLSGDYLVYEILKDKVTPRLDTRAAQLQDYDDILPMLMKDPNKPEHYHSDQYVLADLIQRESPHHYTAVATRNKIAVGMIHVSTEIDYRTVSGNFELDVYHGLRKPSAEDKTPYQSHEGYSIHKCKHQVERDRVLNQDPEENTTQVGEREHVQRKTADFSRQDKSLDRDTNSAQFIEGSPQITAAKELQSSRSGDKNVEKSKTCHSAGNSYENIAITQSNINTECSKQVRNAIVDDENIQYDISRLDHQDSRIDRNAHIKSSVLDQIWFDDLISQMEVEQPSLNHPAGTAMVSEHHGEGNAVAINMFTIKENEAHLSQCLIAKVFKHYKQIDYVVTTQKPDCNNSHLLTLFNRVPKRSNSTFPEDLYVMHRAAISASLTVQYAHVNDMAAIRKMIEHIEGADHFMETLRYEFINGIQEHLFSVKSQDTLVGFLVVKKDSTVDLLKAHYDIEEYVALPTDDCSENVGRLEKFILNPIFYRFKQQVLSELMRVSGYSTLLYTHELGSGQGTHLAVSSMWPVKRRQQIQYSQQALGDNIPGDEIRVMANASPLFITSSCWVHVRKQNISSRIVVIGAGDAGMATLERLVFSRELNFSNITVVDPYGIQGDRHGSQLARDMVSSSENFQQSRLLTLCLGFYITVVRDSMSEIDRKNQTVQLTSGRIICYDKLILTCGLQFQSPKSLHCQMGTRYIEETKNPTKINRSVGSHVFAINNEVEAQKTIERVVRFKDSWQHYYVVYGRCLETLSCLAVLLKLRVDPNRLILIQPAENTAKECPPLTGDSTLDTAVMEKLKRHYAGIEIYQNYSIMEWDYEDSDDLIRISFANDEAIPSRYSLLCSAVFVFDKKQVQNRTFRALNDASLVFDGKLVINSTCTTNDPHIMAAGTMTKYARQYHADHMSHSFYNSREVGSYLGALVARNYGEKMSCDGEMYPRLKTAIERRKNITQQHLTPDFKQPLTTFITMPDQWKLLLIESPNNGYAKGSIATVLKTGNFIENTGHGYMSITIGDTRIIDKIVCYSRDTIDINHMIRLYGLHEVLLNNMVERYREGLISDLYQYLREPWANIIFHDRFKELMSCARTITHQCRMIDGETLEDEVVDTINRYGKVGDSVEQQILSAFRRCGGVGRIEDLVLRYLDTHKYHLPMYARESTAQMLKKEVEDIVKSANEIILSSHNSIHSHSALQTRQYDSQQIH